MPRDKNDKPYEHVSRYGTRFTADRCDFRNGVRMVVDSISRPEHVASDVAEFAAYHALHIHEHLNGFQGYDCIDFQIEVSE